MDAYMVLGNEGCHRQAAEHGHAARRRAFEREAKLLARLDHPALPHVGDQVGGIFDAGGHPDGAFADSRAGIA